MSAQCEICGKYVSYESDGYTPYGCSSYDPPEPHEPRYWCKKHADEAYKKFLDAFKRGSRSGDWEKSMAERNAAMTCGLAWVGSGGVGTLGTENWASAHQYISDSEFQRLSALPYWGYCKLCGTVNKGGYCSDEKCQNSFKEKTNFTNPTRITNTP